MISVPLFVCILGLIGWIIFAKTKLSDPLAADACRGLFFIGAFIALWGLGSQTLG